MGVLFPRALRPAERALLESAIASIEGDSATWRAQASEVLVVGDCTCLCGTIDFGFPDIPVPEGPLRPTIIADGYFDEGDPPFEIILFASKGRLSSLEIVPLQPTPPTEYPTPERVTWYPGPHG